MISLAIIADSKAYLHVIRGCFASIPDVRITDTLTSLKKIDSLIRVQPDVVIIDIDGGAESGIYGVLMLKKIMPNVEILVLSAFDDEEKVVRSIKAGAAGYLLKSDSPENMVQAVRNIQDGQGALSGRVAKILMNMFVKRREMQNANFNAYGMTKRETEILSLLIDGLSYKHIAARSFISMATLNTHIRNIYVKLDIHTRAQIAARFSGLKNHINI